MSQREEEPALESLETAKTAREGSDIETVREMFHSALEWANNWPLGAHLDEVAANLIIGLMPETEASFNRIVNDVERLRWSNETLQKQIGDILQHVFDLLTKAIADSSDDADALREALFQIRSELEHMDGWPAPPAT